MRIYGSDSAYIAKVPGQQDLSLVICIRERRSITTAFAHKPLTARKCGACRHTAVSFSICDVIRTPFKFASCLCFWCFARILQLLLIRDIASIQIRMLVNMMKELLWLTLCTQLRGAMTACISLGDDPSSEGQYHMRTAMTDALHAAPKKKKKGHSLMTRIVYSINSMYFTRYTRFRLLDFLSFLDDDPKSEGQYHKRAAMTDALHAAPKCGSNKQLVRRYDRRSTVHAVAMVCWGR